MNKFIILSVKVTEEISSKYLLTFLRTQISLNQIITCKNSYFYFNFSPQALLYEIVVFTQKNDIYNYGILHFSEYCDEKYTLFIAKEFFCIYENRKLLVIKQISNTSTKDITNYIEQKYKIIPDAIYELSQDKIENIKNKYKNKKNDSIEKELYKVNSDNSFKYFLYYFLLVFFGFGVLFINSYEETLLKNKIDNKTFEKNLYTKDFTAYKKHKQQKISLVLIEIVNYIKKQNIAFENIEYINKELKLKLIVKDKEKLLNLLEYPKKKIVLKSIQFQKELKQYSMEILLDV